MSNARDTWEAAKGGLQVQISKANYDTWVRETFGLSHQGRLFVVGTPNPFACEWLEKRCRDLVTRVLISVLGEQVEVQFQVCAAPGTALAARAGAAATLLPLVNPQHTFDSFVVGACNRLAYAATWGAAEGPAREHNPLYIHGPSGVGKSHIVHALANYAAEAGTRVVCTSGQQFTRDFVGSLRDRRTDEFQAKFRSARLLVVEDVQFMIGKPQTQETLLHTINDLHDANGQLVVTCDRAPVSLTSIDTSLSSRLGAGLIAVMEAPDLDTRLAILRDKAARQQVAIDTSVLEYIARQCQRNVRELEGSLNLVVAQAKMLCQPPTLQLAQMALRSLAAPAVTHAMTPSSILDAVAAYFQISPETLRGRSRDQKVTQARHIAIYLLREKTTCALQDVGRLLGRDHSTILRGHQKIAGMIGTNASVKKSVDQILASFSR